MKQLLMYLVLVVMLCTISSCKDDDFDPGNGVEINGGENVTWSPACQTYQLDINTNLDWKVEVDGGWMTVLQEEGKGRATIDVYVEETCEEADRTGKIKIIPTNGNVSEITVIQKGISSLGDNDGAPVTSLEQTNAVGWGYNGFTSYANGSKMSMKGQIINGAGILKVVADNEELEGLELFKDYSISETDATNTVGSTSEDLTHGMNVDAALNIDLPCGFSMELTANYDHKDLSDINKNFAIKRITHVYKRRVLDVANLNALINSTELSNPTLALSYGFRLAVNKVKTSNCSLQSVKDFIDLFGTHLVIEGDLGGRMDYHMTTDKSKLNSSDELKAGLDIGYNKMFSLKGSVDLEQTANKLGSNYTARINVKGGDSRLLAKAVNGEEGACNSDDIDNWLNSISNKNATLVDFKLIPIWEVIPDQLVADNVKSFLTTGKILQFEDGRKNYTLPTASAGYCQIATPRFSEDGTLIKVAYCGGSPLIEFCEEFIPKISLHNRVIVAYPIKENKPQYEEGLFIGDGQGHKPGKIIWDLKNNECTYTEISEFAPNQILDVIYTKGYELLAKPAGALYVPGVLSDAYYEHNYYDTESKKYLPAKYTLVKIGNQIWSRQYMKGDYTISAKPLNKEGVACFSEIKSAADTKNGYWMFPNAESLARSMIVYVGGLATPLFKDNEYPCGMDLIICGYANAAGGERSYFNKCYLEKGKYSTTSTSSTTPMRVCRNIEKFKYGE